MLRLTLLVCLALFAFAANSLLARAALTETEIGPHAFSLVRLLSGAVMLLALLLFSRNARAGIETKSWAGASMLLVYVLMFSIAYIALDTGTGALALFASVQMTILCVAAFRSGLTVFEIIGAALAFLGFVYLIWPNLASPEAWAVGAMVCSGIGWGIYTLLGRGATQPLALTAGNFLHASLLALPLLVFIPAEALTAHTGLLYAVLSGAITSGCGYAIWYAVVPRLTTAVSGVCQLMVPPIAALMGWAALGEPLTLRLLISTLVIMGGLLLVILGPNRSAKAPGEKQS